MRKPVSFENILAENVALEKIDGGLRVKIDKGEGKLILPDLTGDVYGDYKYFVLDVLPHVEYCESVRLYLFEKGGQ